MINKLFSSITNLPKERESEMKGYETYNCKSSLNNPLFILVANDDVIFKSLTIIAPLFYQPMKQTDNRR